MKAFAFSLPHIPVLFRMDITRNLYVIKRGDRILKHTRTTPDLQPYQRSCVLAFKCEKLANEHLRFIGRESIPQAHDEIIIKFNQIYPVDDPPPRVERTTIRKLREQCIRGLLSVAIVKRRRPYGSGMKMMRYQAEIMDVRLSLDQLLPLLEEKYRQSFLKEQSWYDQSI